MSTSATEFYGYLLQSGYDGDQLSAFEILCDKVNKGEMTMNQSFKKAKKLGYTNANGTSNVPASLQEWIQTAKEAGWIDKGVDALNQALAQQGAGDFSIRYGTPQPPIQPPKKKNNTAIWVAVGVVAIVAIGIAIKKSSNTE